ncbi:hypothetical protein ANN_12773 [Periplaneta americana]|uniref:Uncharacterized protein n=1 Tax=Periplaneta americana TaxID=6978 RepID=A0ABQ8THH4_PERAM|nr:hypothetical protein ANN_12773 [Periplaneta americana]
MVGLCSWRNKGTRGDWFGTRDGFVDPDRKPPAEQRLLPQSRNLLAFLLKIILQLLSLPFLVQQLPAQPKLKLKGRKRRFHDDKEKEEKGGRGGGGDDDEEEDDDDDDDDDDDEDGLKL